MQTRTIARTIADLRRLRIGRHSSLKRVMSRAANELAALHREVIQLAQQLQDARAGRERYRRRLRTLHDWQRKVIRERKEMRDRIAFLSSQRRD